MITVYFCLFPAGSAYYLQVSEVLWRCLMKCWSDKVYLSPLAHRFWKLTLQLYSRYAKFLEEVNKGNSVFGGFLLFTYNATHTGLFLWEDLKWHRLIYCELELPVLYSHSDLSAQVLTKTPAPEVPKEPVRPLPSSASSTSSRTSVDEGGSESGGPASLSTKQLVYIAADIQKLQEQVHSLVSLYLCGLYIDLY